MQTAIRIGFIDVLKVILETLVEPANLYANEKSLVTLIGVWTEFSTKNPLIKLID